MIYLGFNFTDVVVGKPVNNYRDKLGRFWMAHNKWGIFRVELKGKIKGKPVIKKDVA